MERIRLKELNMNSREETLIFLKGLWSGEETACPICGTIHLLDELNREL